MMAKTSLPTGFRFKPTDVELVWYFLRRKIMGKPFDFEAISEVELYKFAPWDLPEKSCLRSRDLEWYFFCPRDKKYARGSRTNRSTDTGYWKTTGKDRAITYKSQTVGMKKTLIFHSGKPPHGTRTDWVMYEFRLESAELINTGFSQDAFVLCKIFEKSGAGPRNGEQYGAPFLEEDWDDNAENGHAIFLPSPPGQEPSENHTFLSAGVPLQSVNYEIGEPSVPNFSEAGVMSSIPAQSVASEVGEIGEPSSIQNLSEARATPSIPAQYVASEVGEIGHLFPIPQLSYADSILFDQLEDVVNAPFVQEIPNCEIMQDDVNEMLNNELYGELGDLSSLPEIGLDDILTDTMSYGEALPQRMIQDDMSFLTDTVGYGELDNLSHLPGIELNDILLTDTVSCGEALPQRIVQDDMSLPDITGDDSSLNQLSEFAAGSYMEINDLGLLSAQNPWEWTNSTDTYYPFADDGNAQPFNSTSIDNADATSRQNCSNDLFPTTEDQLWTSSTATFNHFHQPDALTGQGRNL